MKVLVTGASGTIAETVINILLEEGIEVVATSRDEEKIKTRSFYSKVEYHQLDISKKNPGNLFTFFGKPDSIIHFAWDKLGEPNNILHTTSILDANMSFLENLISNGLTDVNCIGTAYEYGLKEGEQSEDDKPNPVVEYGIAKNNLRKFLEQKKIKYNFDFKWIRVFNVFSPGRSGSNLFSSLANSIQANEPFFNMSGGEQVRDYLTADELAQLIVKISLQKEVQGAINCCSGKPVRLKDLIMKFLKDNNYKIKLNLGYYPYLSHEPMVQWGSVEKLQKIIKNE